MTRAGIVALVGALAACGSPSYGTSAKGSGSYALTGQGPVAQITGGPFSGAAPLAVYLDATTSYTTDPNGWIAAFSWDLGDGTTSTAGWMTHTYASPGNYTVTLTVTDGTGATSSATQQIVASGSGGGIDYCNGPDPSAGQDPVAVIQGGGPDGTFSSSPVYLDATSSYTQDPNGWIQAFFWEFDDGTRSTDAYLTHAFPNPGIYIVAMTATDGTGVTATAFQSVTIGGNVPPPAGTQLLATGSASVAFLALDATSVYWLEGPGLGDGSLLPNESVNYAVRTVPKGGGTATTLATAYGNPNYLAVDESYLWWTDTSTETLYRAPKGGGAAIGFAATDSRQFALDSTAVYAYQRGAQGCYVAATPKSGGTAKLIASDASCQLSAAFGPGLATDGTVVYYVSQDNAIEAVPVGGGAPTIVAPAGTGFVFPSLMKLDGGLLYYRWEASSNGSTSAGIAAVSSGGGTPVVVTRDFDDGVATDMDVAGGVVYFNDGGYYGTGLFQVSNCRPESRWPYFQPTGIRADASSIYVAKFDQIFAVPR